MKSIEWIPYRTVPVSTTDIHATDQSNGTERPLIRTAQITGLYRSYWWISAISAGKSNLGRYKKNEIKKTKRRRKETKNQSLLSHHSPQCRRRFWMIPCRGATFPPLPLLLLLLRFFFSFFLLLSSFSLTLYSSFLYFLVLSAVLNSEYWCE